MSGRDHHADAGGDPEALAAKQALRDEVWTALEDADVARFPGARGRIPNFAGAAEAAARLGDTDAWRAAWALKANPDRPQWPVRQRALEDGRVLYMAVPRLAEAHPFFVLDPAEVDATPRAATSIKGAGAHGRKVPVEELQPVELVVTGCVAVDRTGARLGKGGGFADLEFALAREAGLIGDHTVVATTVHPRQVVEPGRIPMTTHDVPVDVIVTAEAVFECPGRPRPGGIQWEELTDAKVRAIPFLKGLRAEG